MRGGTSLRIIAGKWGGRRIEAPPGLETRPTIDRVREALFSALGSVEGLRVLDLYAGTGALGLEALSRGAQRALFVEQSRAALRCLRGNVQTLGAGALVEVRACEVSKGLRDLPFAIDLVFADPPYASLVDASRCLSLLSRRPGALAPGARAVLEHASRDPSPSLEGWELEAHRTYGDTALSRYCLLVDGPSERPEAR
jgi:16S rRNA (guanine966-N2)-methyltransferase